ncbi:hypothetical protein F2Q69_00001709 [Brassica cretica]|uniref:Uncharacterized protein n=1 Tax=Brassica cretica TaxID=69181 RepID=A0A8S9PJC7_BRACR|nr:hypothetical protein F2Q69_00001709 [Brassica cretica]
MVSSSTYNRRSLFLRVRIWLSGGCCFVELVSVHGLCGVSDSGEFRWARLPFRVVLAGLLFRVLRFLDVIVGRACAATIGRGVLGSRGGGYRVAIFDVQR